MDTNSMNRDKFWERFLFGCLLIAMIIGMFDFILWRLSIEQRLADNLEIHWDGVGTDHSQTSVIENHERRLRSVKRAAWSLWDRRLLFELKKGR